MTPAPVGADVAHRGFGGEFRVGDVEEVGSPEQGDQLVPDRHVGLVVGGVAVTQAVGHRDSSVGGDSQDPDQLLQVRAVVAEFEGALIRVRTCEGMKVARAKGRLRGKQPKPSPKQEAHLVQLHAAGEHTMNELAELFAVGRSTVYRAVDRANRKVEVAK